jgi:2-keto-4-pentenoate hydratase
MAAQADVVRRLGAEVAGWKVAIRPDGLPVAAPLLRHLLVRGDADAAPQHGSGIEVEIAFHLRSDLPPRQEAPYGRHEILEAIGGVLVGVEVIRSRLDNPSGAPFLLFLADNLGNGSFVAGAEAEPIKGFDRARCTVSMHGAIIHDASGRHPNRDPLMPLLAYASRQSDRLGGLRAGQIVATGSLCGLIQWQGPGVLTARIEGIGTVEAHLGE